MQELKKHAREFESNVEDKETQLRQVEIWTLFLNV